MYSNPSRMALQEALKKTRWGTIKLLSALECTKRQSYQSECKGKHQQASFFSITKSDQKSQRSGGLQAWYSQMAAKENVQTPMTPNKMYTII